MFTVNAEVLPRLLGAFRAANPDVVLDLETMTTLRQTEALREGRIDVGLFGSEPTARMILNRMRVHGDPAHAKTGNDPTTAPSTNRAEPLVQ